MRTISPFGLDGNLKNLQLHSPPLTSRAKGYAPPKNMLPQNMNQICKEET